MNFWLYLFFVNWFVNILFVEVCLSKVKNIINVDEERDTKFKAFRRNDVKWFTRPWLYLACHTTLIKLFATFLMLFFTSLWAMASTYG